MDIQGYELHIVHRAPPMHKHMPGHVAKAVQRINVLAQITGPLTDAEADELTEFANNQHHDHWATLKAQSALLPRMAYFEFVMRRGDSVRAPQPLWAIDTASALRYLEPRATMQTLTVLHRYCAEVEGT